MSTITFQRTTSIEAEARPAPLGSALPTHRAGSHTGGVGIVGAGHVGAAVANALVLLGAASRVVLYDRRVRRAEGEAWDIADGTPLVGSAEIIATDDWQDLADVEVAVITVGAPFKPGQSRLDEHNGTLIRTVMEHLDDVAPDAVVVIVSNPVDVLTRIAQDSSARPWHKILGAGTVLDTARLQRGLGQLLGVDARDIHVHVLGEHGDSSFPAWSSATVGPVPLASFPLPPTHNLAAVQSECAERTRRRGPDDILARKGHTDAGVAVAVTRIVESVLRDQRRVYTVSTRALPEYRVGEQAVLSLPSMIGKRGVVRRLPLALNDAEQHMLEESADVLEAAYQTETA
jgi:L-lactate dehydrogenase